MSQESVWDGERSQNTRYDLDPSDSSVKTGALILTERSCIPHGRACGVRLGARDSYASAQEEHMVRVYIKKRGRGVLNRENRQRARRAPLKTSFVVCPSFSLCSQVICLCFRIETWAHHELFSIFPMRGDFDDV
jgi:hypothetical protein